jgi:hypothetical protein
LDDRPQWQRDRLALLGIVSRLRRSGRFTPQQLPRVAEGIFIRQHKRAPERGPEAA